MKAPLCPGGARFFGGIVQWSILLSEHLPCLHGIAQVGVANVAKAALSANELGH